MLVFGFLLFFFFQAEDGIRDGTVTGVQTCALPISPPSGSLSVSVGGVPGAKVSGLDVQALSKLPAEAAKTWKLIESKGPFPYPRKIGRASCRERVEISGVAV